MVAPLGQRTLEWCPITKATPCLSRPPPRSLSSPPVLLMSETLEVDGDLCAAGRGSIVLAAGTLPLPPYDGEDEELVAPVCTTAPLLVVATRPRHVLMRSASVARAEGNLRCALVITVIGQEAAGCTVEVSNTLALRFHLEADALDLRHAAPNTFIGFLPDEELAIRVYNEGRPFITDSLRQHIRRWNRQALTAGGGALLSFVEVTLQGVPAHAWAITTVELLLSNYCLVQRPDRILRSNLISNHSRFKLGAPS